MNLNSPITKSNMNNILLRTAKTIIEDSYSMDAFRCCADPKEHAELWAADFSKSRGIQPPESLRLE